jgi:uncharacterized protein (DUF111 family)
MYEGEDDDDIEYELEVDDLEGELQDTIEEAALNSETTAGTINQILSGKTVPRWS